jgi:hypothetical protein
MIKIRNFYSSPLHDGEGIAEKKKDSLLGVYPNIDKAIKEHETLNRSESIAGDPFSSKSTERFKNLESMKFTFNDKEYNATNLIKD